MKTISKRFLKASLAMLLVVIMLFGSTITGFAASVDNADTKADADVSSTSADSITIRLAPGVWDSTGDPLFYINFNESSKVQLTKSGDFYTVTTDKFKPGDTIEFDRVNPASGGGVWNSFTATIPDTVGTTFTYGIDSWSSASWKYYVNGGDKIYLKPNGQVTGTDFYAYFFNGSGSVWSSKGTSVEEGIYEFTVPTGYYSSVIFATNTNWENQTNNITIDGTGNCYKFTAKGSDTRPYGSWETYTPPVAKPDMPTIDSVTVTNASEGDGTQEKPYIITPGEKVSMLITGSKPTGGADGLQYNVDYTESYVEFTSPQSYTTPTSPAEDEAKAYTIYLNAYNNDSNGSIATRSDNATKTIYVKAVDPNFDYEVKVNNANGGRIITPEVTEGEVAKGESIDIEAEVYEGYTFSGWTSTTGTIGNSSSLKTTFTPNTKNAEVTANFTINTYTITVKETGGNGNVSLSSNTVEHGKTVTVNITAPTNYLIKSVEGAGLPIASATESTYSGITSDITSDTTITVTYIPKTVTYEFVDHDGTVLKEETTINAGETPVAPPEPKREGYTFAGWSPKVDAITSNTTYTAQYTINEYTVKFVDYDNEVIDTQTVEHGSSATAPADPERTGYTFSGWDKEFTEITSDITVTATYTINKYTVNIGSAYDNTGSNPTANSGATPIGGYVTATVDGNAIDFPAEIEYGKEVILTINENEGYRFKGWIKNGMAVEFSETFTVTDDVEGYLALFIKQYTVTVNKTEQFASFTVNGGNPCTTKFEDEFDVGTKITISADNASGFRFLHWVDENGDVVCTTKEYAVDSLQSNINVTPIAVPLYSVKVGETVIGNYAQGDPVEYTFPEEDEKYLIAVTAEGIADSDITTDIKTGKVSFTMPGNEVVLTPKTAPYVYFTLADGITGLELSGEVKCKAGVEATVKVSPKTSDISIESITASTDATITENTDGTYDVYVKSVPNDGVVISGEVNAKFKMEYDIKVVDNFTDKDVDCCKVEITAADYSEGYVSYGSTVTYKAIGGRSGNKEYQFDGFYSDENYENLITRNTTHSFTADAPTKLYARFVRKVFIVGDVAQGWETLVPMSYDFDNNNYYYKADIDTGTFKISPVNNLSASNFSEVWKSSTLSNTGIKFARESSSDKSSNGVFSGLDSNYTLPITITFSNTSGYTVNATASKADYTIYLSSGREDYDRNGSAAFTVKSEFIGYEGKYTIGDTNHDPDNESYTRAYLSKDVKYIDVQTTISGTNTYLYKVGRYLVYDIATGLSHKVDATNAGNGVYKAKIEITGSTYIVPIYFADEDYETLVNGKSVEITVDLKDIVGDTSFIKWGPFVSCYPYGTATGSKDTHDFTGAWPGQLMTPVSKGSTIYTTRVIIGEGENLQGLVFSNYLSHVAGTDKTAATFLKSEFNLSGYDFRQTYDYKEAVYLYNNDYDVITYEIKPNTDGYHGDDNLSGVDANAGSYEFVDLKNRNGELMDLYAKPITGSTNENEYYVIAKGDVNYEATGSYKLDATYSGKWSVVWYIYDKDGKYLTSVLSGSFYDDTNGTAKDGNSVLIEQLLNVNGQTKDKISGAKVHISYEKMNAGNGSSYQRVDGQWYGNKTTEDITANIKVGLFDGNDFIIDTEDPVNEATYGTAAIKNKSGDFVPSATYTPSEDAELGVINVDVSAQPISSGDKLYRFKGFYSYENNVYKLQDSSTTCKFPISIDKNTDIYAIFEEVAQDQLVVTHQIYTNTSDREIFSHDGSGTRIVEIWDCTEDGTIIGDVPLSSGSGLTSATANYQVVDGKSYKIVVKTEIAAPDYFYAWYMRGDTADLYGTYEEVFTEESDYGKSGVVESSFVYTYKDGMPTQIEIFSDIFEVSAVGRLVYTYKNRDNLDRTIIKTYDMSDQEIIGFAGNGGDSMRPAYKQYTTMFNNTTSDKVNVYTDQEIADYQAKGYSISGTGSNIYENIPNAYVTEAFNKNISWSDKEEHLVFDPKDSTTIKIDAISSDVTFTVTAEYDGNDKTYEDKPYNFLIKDLEAPIKNSENKTFSYWKDKKTGEVLSYSRYYYYRIVSERDIVAVYGENTPDAWTPVIENIEYTREYQDASDYVYTDYLIAFHSRDGLEIEQLKKEKLTVDGNEVSRVHSYGLVLMRNPNYNITKQDYDNNAIQYPNYDGIETDVVTIAEAGKSNEINGYNAYCFEFSDEKTTNLNRIHHYIRYNNRHAKDYKTYAFSAYAFLRIYNDDGTLSTYISNPKNVDFFNLGSLSPEELSN